MFYSTLEKLWHGFLATGSVSDSSLEELDVSLLLVSVIHELFQSSHEYHTYFKLNLNETLIVCAGLSKWFNW